MNITRAEINALCQPGDVIAVEYIRKDLIATGIGLAEEGKATHALCCCGGLDIVEANINGVNETNLRNYLRGNTILTIRSAIPAPDALKAETAVQFWLDRVNDPYDMPMIFGMLFILVARHIVGRVSERAGAWILCHVPNLLASKTLSTCAELGIRGIRRFYPGALGEIPPANIDPELLRTHASLYTKKVLDAAILVD